MFVSVYGSFGQEITKRKCKTKTVEADLGIFTHIPKYSGIFKHIQILFRHIN